MEDITTHQVNVIEDANFSLLPRLTNAYTRPPRALVDSLHAYFGADSEIRVGSEGRFNEWGLAQRGDVVSFQVDAHFHIGEIVAIFEVDGTLGFGINTWKLVSRNAFVSNWDDRRPAPMIIEAECIEHTLCWRREGDLVQIVRPPS